MKHSPDYPVSRRQFLTAGGAVAASLALSLPRGTAYAATRQFGLRPQPGSAQLVPEEYGATEVLCFNGRVPGPEIRVRQGERVRISVDNALDQPTTVHWHGLRLANDMDGVPWLTQPPIAAGDQFVYEFNALDAGTFWYHPHMQSASQIGRGLYGALIVEEPESIQVDRDLTWVLDDWRLAETAQIVDDFGHRHDASHNGRIGNTMTVNGAFRPTLQVQSGERVRLRLINAANARIFRLGFSGHAPTVIAIDGQPVTPHTADDNAVIVGPAMRVDLILDMTAPGDSTHEVVEDYFEGRSRSLATIQYGAFPLRSEILQTPIALAPNPLAEPDTVTASRHDVAFEGGAMGGMTGAMLGDTWRDIREMVHEGKFWSINGVAATGHVLDPMMTFRRGESVVLNLHNNTAWPHPIHLHGHSFRVLSRNGKPTRFMEWQDTVLLDRNERAEIALVFDNPGDWMFHCHILEHQASGMMAVIRVT